MLRRTFTHPTTMSPAASRYTFRIHSFDVDAFGNVAAPRLLGYLLESASNSADSLGFGIAELQCQGLTWVLGRIRIELDSILRVGDTIEIETWPSGIERAVTWRDFRIVRAGTQIGRATSIWFVLDMTTRLPVRPHSVLPEPLHPQTDHVIRLSRSIERPSTPVAVRRQFEVRQSDIDLNQHVTAASYIAWAMETVPRTLWESSCLATLDVNFLEECLLGDNIVAESFVIHEQSLQHRIIRESDAKELARLCTSWVVRRRETAVATDPAL